MTGDTLYSIRMRATTKGRHVSGAEKIVAPDRIDATVSGLIARARNREKSPGEITITIESLAGEQVKFVKALDLVTINALGWEEGRACAVRVLCRAGVSEKAVEAALGHLSRGAAASGGSMRGAMIMDAQTGERLEPDQERGVRASRFDWSNETGEIIGRALGVVGLLHFRTKEALALATKVVHGPGIVAELCWSDDPDYTAGYVASLQTGYVRFPFLKKKNDGHGGRAIFIDRNNTKLEKIVSYLQTDTVLINSGGECRPETDVETYLAALVRV